MSDQEYDQAFNYGKEIGQGNKWLNWVTGFIGGVLATGLMQLLIHFTN